jgi:hypothetical protein
MAIHDWTRVDEGAIHDFHHSWIEELMRALNRGLLPENYYAMAEQSIGKYVLDVLTLQHTGEPAEDADDDTSVSRGTLAPPPAVRFTATTDPANYVAMQNSVTASIAPASADSR